MGADHRAATMMRNSWNKRAEQDAFHYVETTREQGDIDGFFALGEERARILIDPVLPPSRGSALDIGCGLGRMSRALSRRFEQVTAVDVSDKMVKQATDLNSKTPNISFLLGDGLSYPVETETMDFAFSYEVFQHMPDHQVIESNVKSVGRALKKGGSALIHLKTGFGQDVGLFRRWAHNLPTWMLAPVKRMLGIDPLKTDETYRGALPLSAVQIHRLFDEAGMTVNELRPDPTHSPGSRTFVHATRRN